MTYQVNERQKFPAASIGLVRWHVNGLVIAQNGKIGEEDGDPQHLPGNERHVASPSQLSKAFSVERAKAAKSDERALRLRLRTRASGAQQA